MATRRLKYYFDAHKIVILASYPLKNILGKPEQSGRLSKIAIELSKFDIQYRPRSSIKGQELAEFVTK